MENKSIYMNTIRGAHSSDESQVATVPPQSNDIYEDLATAMHKPGKSTNAWRVLIVIGIGIAMALGAASLVLALKKESTAELDSAHVYLGEQVNMMNESLKEQQKANVYLGEQVNMMNESLNEQQKAHVYLGEQVNMMNESFNEQQKDINRLQKPDCKVLLQAGNVESGIYNLLKDGRIFKVYCDMTTSGGGWTVFQRRCDGTQDFSLDWNEYRRGFGKKEGEFWMGLDDLHSLLSNGRFQLRIDMTACNNQSFFAEYRSFNVLGSSTNYQLQIGDFEGSPGLRNSMEYSDGQPFSTIDRDNDVSTSDCAELYGAWWHSSCGIAFLNGDYSCSSDNWYNGTGFISVRFSEMKFRPY